ncbi:hypothetical protein H2203_005724 [Taxawa tesnikishii (nom. ined.)]|nr:hypothetical protein H2203_005724 [Dothideales sp. JES 119]
MLCSRRPLTHGFPAAAPAPALACRRRSHSYARWISRHHYRSRALVAAAGLILSGYAFFAPISNTPLLPRLHADSREDPKDWSSKPTRINHNSQLRDRFTVSGDSKAYYDADHSSPGQQAPPPQTKGHRVIDSIDHVDQTEITAWQKAVDNLTNIKDGVTGFDLSQIGEKITDMIMPKWAKQLPGFISKLQDELSMAPGTLADEIWREAHDSEINPEITWDASVRVGDDLCIEELDFLEKRKTHTTAALAKYLNVPESEIHPDDVPIIAMCGSGGGLRALVAGTSSYLSAYEAGLFDCVTYTAGVSGSCWLQTLYYSSIGQQSHARLLRHLKHRLGIHIAFPPAALGLLSSAPTNKYLLSGAIEKLKGVPDADFGLVDAYGVLLAARLMVPKGDLNIDEYDLKLSNQRDYVDHGAYPMPIYTAVRHEIPIEDPSSSPPAEIREKARKEAWFQWFEWTPYEFYCDELGAGVPTWAIGRNFDHGRSVWRDNGLALPEMREIQPIVKGLAGFGGIDQLIAERDEDLIKVHPINPATIPNFVLGMREMLPSTCPESIHTVSHLQLMDAGMSNNLPIYPLLRPGRDVDIIITFDASADVRKDNWIKVADGYVRQRGIKGWPLGAGWPSESLTEEQTLRELEAAQASSADEASAKIAEAQQQSPPQAPRSSSSIKEQRNALGAGLLHRLARPRRHHADLFPFLANPKVPGVDPQTSDFMSTWNFVYTEEEIEQVVSLARANFEEGREQTRRTVRAVWERKRRARMEREEGEREDRKRERLRLGKESGKKYGTHGDQFS